MEQEPWFWTEKQADQHGLHPMEHTIIFVPCGPCVQVHEGTVIIELSNNQHLVKIHYIGCAWLACQCTLTQTGDNMLVYVKVVILVTTNWLDEYYSPMCYSQDRLTCDISWRALFGASNACRFAGHMWASLLERRYQQALHQLAWRKNVPSSCVFEIEKQHTHLECFGWDVFYLSTLGICLKKIIHLIFLQFSTEFVLHIAIRIMLYPAGWFAELEEPLVQPSWSYSWIYWLISLTENKQNSSKFQVAYPHGYKWCDLYTIWETQQWPWANPDISHGNASHPSISWLVKLWKAQGVSPGMGCQEKVSATDACCVSKQFWIQRAKIPRLPRAGNVLHSMQQVTASIIYNHIYICNEVRMRSPSPNVLISWEGDTAEQSLRQWWRTTIEGVIMLATARGGVSGIVVSTKRNLSENHQNHGPSKVQSSASLPLPLEIIRSQQNTSPHIISLHHIIWLIG